MNKDYYKYLTKKLDEGISENPVVEETIERINEILRTKPIVHLVDIGCFCGSLANRIYRNLPSKFRNRVKLVGLDNYRESLDKGKKNYPEITFIFGDLLKKSPLIKQYDIAILSNVLHEIFSEKIRVEQKSSIANGKVKLAIHNAVNLLNNGGYLIILDGIKPPFAHRRITVEFASNLTLEKFLDFAKKYKAMPIGVRKLSGGKIMTDIGSLAIFLTKARYLTETYWDQESSELYQYFTARDFEVTLRAEKTKVAKFELQEFSEKEIKKQIKFIKPDIKIPPKNVLIVAKKI